MNTLSHTLNSFTKDIEDSLKWILILFYKQGLISNTPHLKEQSQEHTLYSTLATF